MTERSFARALWIQALAAGSALALSAASSTTLVAMLFAGAFAALVLRVLGKRLSRRMESVVAITACLSVPVDVVLHDFEIAPPLARFLLVLQLAKLLGPRERRDEGTILVVALVHVAVAASSTVEPIFAPLVLAYGASAVYALALRQLRGLDPEAPANPPIGLSFRAGLFAVGVAVVLIATAVFFSIPRVGAKLLPMPSAQQERVSGYSDSIAMDETGRIRESGRRAFRADVIQRGKLPPSPLWRGQALASYDGSVWTPAPRNEKVGHQFGQVAGIFDLDVGRPVPRDATIVEIYLEPMRSFTLFTPGIGHTVEFKTPAPPLLSRDAYGSLISSVQNARNVAYRLVCEYSEVLPAGLLKDSWGRPQMTPPEKVKALCLQLPPHGILDRDRLKTYALSVLRAAGAERAGVLGRATVLAEHLQKNFKYTLDARKTPGVERITDFIFTTKEGHCEIFAGALTVLLRTIGIPARVVNGFRGGEYHSWTDTYTVLDKHAHAWVEALCDEGWVTLDPTPSLNDDDLERTGVLAALEDARIWFEIRWFKNVVALDMNDQEHFLRGLVPALDSFRETMWRVQQERSDLKVLAFFLALGLVLGTAIATLGPRWILRTLFLALVRLRERLRRPTPAELLSRELEPVIRALEARGLRRGAQDTAQDLARAAVERFGVRARLFEAIVPAYYAARYGGRPLTAEERDAIQEAARALSS